MNAVGVAPGGGQGRLEVRERQVGHVGSTSHEP